MVSDVNRAMGWIVTNIAKYGGDHTRIYVVGQSAGAHLFANAMINQSVREAEEARFSVEGFDDESDSDDVPQSPDRRLTNMYLLGDGNPPPMASPVVTRANGIAGLSASRSISRTVSRTISQVAVQNAARFPWRTSKIHAFIGLSGPYDLLSFRDFFHRQGLHRSVQDKIFNGPESLAAYSPTLRVVSDKYIDSCAAAYLPPIYLLHGDADTTCPAESSRAFAEALRSLDNGPSVVLRIYGGKSHTDPIIEDLLHAEFDDSCDVLADILRIVLGSNYPDSPNSLAATRARTQFHVKRSCSNLAGSDGVRLNSSANLLAPDQPSGPSLGVEEQCEPVLRTRSRLRPNDTLGYYDDPLNPPSVTAAHTMLPRSLINLARKVNPF
jgi:acetyl esterase/lipase